ncbi:MAG: metal-dependent hydrolase [Flavobacteriales bacterium]|nr:metal-dependent hydrolase [Flavobacteriales bacterium]
MDLITHTCSGLAVGTVVANVTKGSPKQKLGILLISTLGGALPDVDAISMWSGFDSSFGEFFNLEHSGRKIYGSQFWYSLHGFTHSILGSLVLCFLGLIISRLVVIKKHPSTRPLRRKAMSRVAAFLGAYWIHLIEDMPTPSSVWQGIDLFFPIGGYVGGFGQIWWWNNYDIFLLAIAVIISNIIILIINSFVKRKRVGQLSIAVFLFCFAIAIYQINTRPFDFQYTDGVDYGLYEQKSKEIQKEILGNWLYEKMVKLDKMIPLYF